MNQIHNQGPLRDSSGLDLCGVLAQALAEEIKALEAFDLYRGALPGVGQWKRSIGTQHHYTFELTEALRQGQDARLKLRLGQEEIPGLLISSRGLRAQIVFERYLGEHLPHTHIVLDRTSLLRMLSDRIQSLVRDPAVTFGVAGHLFKPLDDPSESAHTKRHFVWGPPGTGKTHHLARLTQEALENGERVLLAAHTHRALDVCLRAVVQALGQAAASFEMLRMGSTPPKSNGAQASLTLDAQGESIFSTEHFLQRHAPDVYEKKIALTLALKQSLDQLNEWQRHRLPTTAKERVKHLRDDISALEKSLEILKGREKSIIKSLLPQISLVACTITQTFLTDDWAGDSHAPFDLLIVDEASQISLPALFYAATLAKKKVVVVGDFCQMGPIALNQTEHGAAMREDIFSWVGFSKLVETPAVSGLPVTVLTHQRRMHPDISKLVSEVFYGGWLKNEPKLLETNATPALSFLDTSDRCALTTAKGFDRGGSRINLMHAVLALRCAETFLLETPTHRGEKKIALITPYREQVRLLNVMVVDRGLEHLLDVATVHQFQGEERDTVIFDSVESPGVKPSPLTEGERGSSAGRAINVAFSRAKRHLVVLANKTYLEKSLAPKAVFRSVLQALGPADQTLLARLMPQVTLQKNSSREWIGDVANAKERVVLHLPLLFGKIPSEIFECLVKVQAKGVALLFNTLGPKIQRQLLKEQFQGVNDFFLASGCQVLCHDIPQHDVFQQNMIVIDDQKVWFSAGDFLENQNLFSIEGTRTIEVINDFFGFSILNHAPRVTARCPLCEGQMVTMWNRRRYESQGDFYAACGEGCGYNRPLLKDEGLARASYVPRSPVPTQKPLPGFMPPMPKKESLVLPRSQINPHEKHCPQCGSLQVARYKEGTYLFLGCKRYPECHYRSVYQEPCSRCQNAMVVRRSKTGIFLGCMGFPQCKNTREISESVITQAPVLVG